MVDIFISYANEDQSKVELLAKALKEEGWSVFWDRTIPAGTDWHQGIADTLENARSVIVVWSKSSVNSRWVQKEAASGLERNILIPILIDNVESPMDFRSIQAVDFISWEPMLYSTEFEKLIAIISEILGPPPNREKMIKAGAAKSGTRLTFTPFISLFLFFLLTAIILFFIYLNFTK